MDRYHMLSGSSRTFPLLGAQSREQAMVYLLALAREKPVFLNSMAALMKVTAAADVHASCRRNSSSTVQRLHVMCGYSSVLSGPQTICVEFGKCDFNDPINLDCVEMWGLCRQSPAVCCRCSQCTRLWYGCMLVLGEISAKLHFRRRLCISLSAVTNTIVSYRVNRKFLTDVWLTTNK